MQATMEQPVGERCPTRGLDDVVLGKNFGE